MRGLAIVLVLLLTGCTSTTDAAAGGARGTAWVGPTCPVERYPPEPGCEPRPFEGELAVLAADGDEVVKRFTTASDGSFEVTLAAGSYVIGSPPGGATLPNCSSETFVVSEGQFTDVTVDCDSGIR